MPGYLSTWISKARRFVERLWVRIVVIAVVALAAVSASSVTGPYVPDGLKGFLADEATDGILHIIASSMLAVTIFSLSVMVQIHRAVSGQWTPRAHRLVLRDRTTITVLSTFIGAWLFALMGIILRSAGFVGGQDTVVLFVLTLIVVGLIVVTIVRWASHLELLGSLAQTNDGLEREAREAIEARMRLPCLGGRPLTGGRDAIPWDAQEVRSHETGWLRWIYAPELDDIGREHGTDIHVWAPVGRFVYEGEVLAYVGSNDPEVHDAVRRNMEIGSLRTFEQDPRFGLVVLSEVASKALSPGINDSGTAIDVIGRAARTLLLWRDEGAGAGDPRHVNLHVPPLRPADLIEDAFAPIIRDGAAAAEVQIHLQRALGALSQHDDPAMAAAARKASAEAWERAREKLSPRERERVGAVVPRLEAAA